MAQNAIPYEPGVRAWLRGSRVTTDEMDEIIQDCYCRFAMLDCVAHIERPDIYFFAMARNLLIRSRRRAKVVPIDNLANVQDTIIDDMPSPETTTADRHAFALLKTLILNLPERCQRIIEMRKFDRLSQREIAATLGITESIVENDVQFGVRYLRAAWRDTEERANAAMDRISKEGAHP